jgi:hypothetical protein
MSEKRWLVSVLLIAFLYIGVGVAGFVYHFTELLAGHPDAWAMEVTELLAVVIGAFLLRRQNWARWLALAWILFHVAISFGGPVQPLVMHCLLCVLIAWVLFRPAAGRWFRGEAAGV